MPRQIPIDTVISAVLNGYVLAQQQYDYMTGGWWLWKAPEYFITSCIAQSLHAMEGPKYITLEHGSKSALEDAGAKRKGKLAKDLRASGKVDILFWWGSELPRAIIEVKNQVYATVQYEKDIKRIKAFLKCNTDESSFQFGIFSFYQSASDGSRKPAQQKVKDRVESIFNRTIAILGEDYKASLYTTEMRQDGIDSAWQAGVVLIKSKKQRITSGSTEPAHLWRGVRPGIALCNPTIKE